MSNRDWCRPLGTSRFKRIIRVNIARADNVLLIVYKWSYRNVKRHSRVWNRKRTTLARYLVMATVELKPKPRRVILKQKRELDSYEPAIPNVLTIFTTRPFGVDETELGVPCHVDLPQFEGDSGPFGDINIGCYFDRFIVLVIDLDRRMILENAWPSIWTIDWHKLINFRNYRVYVDNSTLVDFDLDALRRAGDADEQSALAIAYADLFDTNRADDPIRRTCIQLDNAIDVKTHLVLGQRPDARYQVNYRKVAVHQRTLFDFTLTLHSLYNLGHVFRLLDGLAYESIYLGGRTIVKMREFDPNTDHTFDSSLYIFVHVPGGRDELTRFVGESQTWKPLRKYDDEWDQCAEGYHLNRLLFVFIYKKSPPHMPIPRPFLIKNNVLVNALDPADVLVHQCPYCEYIVPARRAAFAADNDALREACTLLADTAVRANRFFDFSACRHFRENFRASVRTAVDVWRHKTYRPGSLVYHQLMDSFNDMYIKRGLKRKHDQ